MASRLRALVAQQPLRLGASGDAVRSMQLGLKAAGFPLDGTGYYGNKTDTAVEALQRQLGLPANGVMDFPTARGLDNILNSAAPPPKQAEVGRPLWLQYSLDHIGLKEAAGAADNKQLVRDIQTVAPDYQHDSTPWCAGWVSLCLSKAGNKPSALPLWARSYASTEWGVKLIGPAVGAIGVKTRGSGGHVTFIAGRTAAGALACCGGNQGDAVSIVGYPARDLDLGFWWPKDADPPKWVGMGTLPVLNTAGKIVSEA